MSESSTTPTNDTLSFVIEGDVNVQVNITENGDGTLQFDLSVLDDTGSIGDLNGLFFDYLEPSLVDGLTATGDDITGQAFKANGVTKVGPGNNIQGEIGHDPFDCGVSFGNPGKGDDDDLQETSFTLSHDSYNLSLEDFESMDFAVRLTSVGEVDGAREGSLKLDGTAPDLPDTPEPEVENPGDGDGPDTDLPGLDGTGTDVPGADPDGADAAIADPADPEPSGPSILESLFLDDPIPAEEAPLDELPADEGFDLL